eukprot:CAMPEP_0203895740 /NCGR_PEP_ID=MMETSP0359-20131031/38558_1 /ASSEMBLY_ACC=CAM_ASM_000338 /TAXON_ID=268821 /ORGANISM="Scrippsiella Hangoei, Strain SHTV-5" /LENGTH=144 /DNA_ID=CAMNT_0050818283 /DNA_START=9 /DNA_END=444 /DNA_ORIENTATION=+
MNGWLEDIQQPKPLEDKYRGDALGLSTNDRRSRVMNGELLGGARLHEHPYSWFPASWPSTHSLPMPLHCWHTSMGMQGKQGATVSQSTAVHMTRCTPPPALQLRPWPSNLYNASHLPLACSGKDASPCWAKRVLFYSNRMVTKS